MQIVIPMAGSGKRFTEARFSEIKPLIKIHGRPMIEYVINFFPGEDDFLFICANEHLKKTKLESVLKTLKPSGKIVGIDFKPLHGPVYGIIWAEKHIKDNEPVIFSYCDYDIFWQFEDFKKFAQDISAHGIVVSYSGFHPHLLGTNYYAGVKTDEKNRILEIKEKYSYTPDKMDSWHSCGMYYFKSGKLAKEYFNKHAKGPAHENGEYYISTVYNDMIKEGLLCLNYPINYFCQWGTPEDLEEYEMWMERVTSGYIPPDDIERKIFDYWKKFLNLKS